MSTDDSNQLPQGYAVGGGSGCGNCKYCYFKYELGWEETPDETLYCQHGIVDDQITLKLVVERIVNELDICIEYKQAKDFCR